MSQRAIAVLGGGIGGLSLAIALQRKGFVVTVYESTPEIKPLGAGLSLAANAVKAFMEIGISDRILKAGKILKLLQIRSAAGAILTETDSEKIAARFGIVNNFTIHRADLHKVLLDELAPGSLQLNKQCIDFTPAGAGTLLKFRDGTSAYSDYVIACDGIHSVIRKKLLPNTTPRYAGYTCWRAVIDNIPPDVDMNVTSETWGRGSRFGIVPLSSNRVYWFACINAPYNDPAMRAMRITDLLTYFKGFHSPVPQILKNTPDDKMIWNDIIDIKPLRQFAFNNMLLLGDAAHATTPNMGQGACMAIEDAAILANCMQSIPSIPDAFLEFEKKRIPRTTRIVNNSWSIGKLAQLENKALIGIRNAAIKFTPPSVTEKQIRFLTDINFH